MRLLDPRNPVSQVFYLRAGVHPVKAPEPPKPEPVWKEGSPDAANQFMYPKRLIESWFQK
jgi:hypothetical protein